MGDEKDSNLRKQKIDLSEIRRKARKRKSRFNSIIVDVPPPREDKSVDYLGIKRKERNAKIKLGVMDPLTRPGHFHRMKRRKDEENTLYSVNNHLRLKESNLKNSKFKNAQSKLAAGAELDNLYTEAVEVKLDILKKALDK